MLELKGVSKRFGGLRALDSMSMYVPEGSIRGLIGPNGAGKTTVFNVVTGAVRPDSGEVFFQGRSITGLMPHRIVRRGISRTFQNIRLFQRLSCLENVCIPMLQSEGPVKSLMGFLGDRERDRKARGLLELVGLGDVMDRPAGTLPYGLQRKLEIARALASSPKLLLLDEPAAGMNPEESRGLADFIARVRDRFGLTVVLIEHHMDVVMRICDRITVMNFGSVLFEGTPQETVRSDLVLEAYLGRSRVPCHA
ncbi:ABC-type branched-chain amino acid transport system, ATPase component [Thermanaerovibrio velox DSM 12556]|uniref:ABC-type branched-chain amino acid transport system, ATPase component n=1 Tax=Thermanaerovibrio velox DSM 12556 TaxID=926567 RepID=H0UP76_9BACT|nr:ABC transporter ATP-binding protein [Thermanaerovibrio velox]EHM09489.1 ABC-type branched-chain amino acid transport system, ATPase component [Thermanaerovibrio velox DSM 12556]